MLFDWYSAHRSLDCVCNNNSSECARCPSSVATATSTASTAADSDIPSSDESSATRSARSAISFRSSSITKLYTLNRSLSCRLSAISSRQNQNQNLEPQRREEHRGTRRKNQNSTRTLFVNLCTSS